MTEERRRGGDESELEDVGGGPGQAYAVFAQMDSLLDKAKLLNYDREFCASLHFKPFSRHYFAIASNPGEQFPAFTSFAAWLVRKCGRSFIPPQESDDPNATIAEILQHVKELGHSIDFPPSKLKQGCGAHAVHVLNLLADEALQSVSFNWRLPSYPEEEAGDELVIEDEEAELLLDKPERESALGGDLDAEDEDDEEGQLFDLNLGASSHAAGAGAAGSGMLRNKMAASSGAGDSGLTLKLDNVLESQTDAAEWRLEVERVLPQLKVTISTDNKDWRVHVDEMHRHQEGIAAALASTRGHLDRLYEEVSRTLEKIASREKYLNQQLEQLLGEYRAVQSQLAETRERYKQGSGGVTERTRILAEITEELEKVKQEMEERGSSMTDGSPLVKIKQAIQRIKQEIAQMDIRAGVVEHMLLQAKLRDKQAANDALITY